MFVYNNMVHDARVRREATTLARAGYEVTVLAVREPGPTRREETLRGFSILRISRSVFGVSREQIRQRFGPAPARRQARPAGPMPRWLSMLDTATRLPVYPLRRALVFFRFLRAALRIRADVYHAHDMNTLLVAWAASRLRRVPLVYDTHEVETDREGMKLRWWASFLERALIHRADRVICTNRTRADYTQQRYRIPPPTVLRNFPEYAEPKPSALMHEALGLAPEVKIVLYQGGVQPARGLEQLLEAAPHIQGGVIVILGNGRLKPALQHRVRQMKLEGKVLFHDAVPVEELPSWTACAYIGLQILQNTCFNHYSSLSNKLLEYLMAGVPAVTSDLPEMRRVIEDTGAGLLVDAADPVQITAAVNKVLADAPLRAEMSGKAKAARRRYAWEAEEHVLRKLYAELLSRGAPDAPADPGSLLRRGQAP
jgi:glycosyltransferase involved in cell wall biosynthesis